MKVLTRRSKNFFITKSSKELKCSYCTFSVPNIWLKLKTCIKNINTVAYFMHVVKPLKRILLHLQT